MRFVVFNVVCLLVVVCSRSAAAQQPFSFVVATPNRDQPRAESDALAFFAGKRLDPLTGIQTTVGRITMLALEDSRFDRRDQRQTRQAEFLMDLWGSSSGATLAAGTGIRRESGGTNVLLTRVVAEAPAFAGRLIGNAVIEKPLVGNRDAMDVITTVAYTRHVGRGVFVGGEALLQDIEGFWNPAEAEGGARLFLGPSVDVAPASRNWTLHVTAGREMRATQTTGASEAFRAIGRPGFVMRWSANRRF
jgi:hypothetical protein